MYPPSIRKSLTLGTATLATLSHSQPLTTRQSSQDCSCYKPSADTNAFFRHHKFFDFRQIANPSTPETLSSPDADAAAGPAHPYFSTPAWTSTWGIQTWRSPAQSGVTERINSFNNIYIGSSDDSSTHLTLRTQRFPTHQSTAEIESKSQNYHYLSARMRARTRGDPGAVTALFTYKGNPNPDLVQEADIEILTSGKSEIHYTNQPGLKNGDVQPEATRLVDSDWSQWQEHRYDWTPGSSDWYVDGQKVASIEYQTPTDPLSVLLNVWSDGGVWSGVMDVGGSAEMQIQWLDLAFNEAGDGDGGVEQGDCANVCVVDDLVS